MRTRFLCKAAAYFDVSCDYMLGMSDSKDDFVANFDKGESILDSEYRMNTVLRAIMMLYSRYSDADIGKETAVKITLHSRCIALRLSLHRQSVFRKAG